MSKALATDTSETQWAAFDESGNVLGVWHARHGFTDERVIKCVDKLLAAPTAVIRRRVVRTVCDEWEDVRRPCEVAS